MTNIENAIRVEQEYLDYRRSNGESLSTLLEPFGYVSLDDYFKDKAEYQLKTQNYEYYTLDVDNLFQIMEESFIKERPAVYIVKPTRTVLWHGKDEDPNRELCEQLGYDIISLDYNGGNIVTGVGDFNFVVICRKVVNINTQWFMQKFAAYFSKYFDDVVCNENDILINGNKIMGSMQRESETMFEFATQISFVDRSDDIYRICPPTGGKKPSAIPNGYFSCDDLWDEVLSWLKL